MIQICAKERSLHRQIASVSFQNKGINDQRTRRQKLCSSSLSPERFAFQRHSPLFFLSTLPVKRKSAGIILKEAHIHFTPCTIISQRFSLVLYPLYHRHFSITPSAVFHFPEGKDVAQSHHSLGRGPQGPKRGTFASVSSTLAIKKDKDSRVHLQSTLQTLCKGKVSKAFKALSFAKRHKTAGRNASGSITMFHRGGGCKRLQRRIDFRRNSFLEHTGIVERIEYDPNRSSSIALIRWVANHDVSHLTVKETQPSVISQARDAFSYILASANLKVGDKIKNYSSDDPHHKVQGTLHSSPNDSLLLPSQSRQALAVIAPISTAVEMTKDTFALRRSNDESVIGQRYDLSYQKSGDCMPLSSIAIGALVHNIESNPGQGGKVVRAAGTFARLVQRFEHAKQAIVKLPSGVSKSFDSRCRATMGTVSNSSHNTISLTKAGQTRWLGRRPIVRGVAMNPIDHPHGGGEGRSKGGRPSVSPWGKPSKGGFKTALRKQKK